MPDSNTAAASEVATYLGEVDSPAFLHGSAEEVAHAAEVAAHDLPLEHSAADQAVEAAAAAGVAVVGEYVLLEGGVLAAADAVTAATTPAAAAAAATTLEAAAATTVAGEGAAAAVEIASHVLSGHEDAASGTYIGEVDAPSFTATSGTADTASAGSGTYIGEVDAPGFTATSGTSDTASTGSGTYIGEVDAPEFTGAVELPADYDGAGPGPGIEPIATDQDAAT